MIEPPAEFSVVRCQAAVVGVALVSVGTVGEVVEVDGVVDFEEVVEVDGVVDFEDVVEVDGVVDGEDGAAITAVMGRSVTFDPAALTAT